MKLLEQMQQLMQLIGLGSIRLDRVSDMYTGVLGEADQWLIPFEVWDGCDLMPVWMMAARLRETTGRPVMPIVLVRQRRQPSMFALRYEQAGREVGGVVLNVVNEDDFPGVSELVENIPALVCSH